MAYSGDAGAGQYYSSLAVHASSYHSASHGLQHQAVVPATSVEDEVADTADAAPQIAAGSGLHSDDVNLEIPGGL